VRGHAELAERQVMHVVRLLYGFETCLPRNTRRRNEKLISRGGLIANPCPHSSSRPTCESLRWGSPTSPASAILRAPKEYSCGQRLLGVLCRPGTRRRRPAALRHDHNGFRPSQIGRAHV